MDAFQTFLEQYPAYADTASIDTLRTKDYARLDRGRHIYLDYTGGGIYADAQIQQHHQLLRDHVFGNPHSSNPTSLAATQLVESARSSILDFFNADPAEYLAIFTANVSAALKLVGASYPVSNGSYLFTFENHKPVNGIREFAHSRGAQVTFIPVPLTNMGVAADKIEFALSSLAPHNLVTSRWQQLHHQPINWTETC